MEITIKQFSSMQTKFSYDSSPELSAASAFRGERFSYQIVIIPSRGYRYHITFDAGELQDAVKLYKLKDAVLDQPLSVTEPDADVLTKEPGFFPDILVPAAEENDLITLKAGEKQILWVRVDVPDDAPAGKHNIAFEFTPVRGHYWDPLAENAEKAVFELDVLPYTLPKQELKYTQWFYNDCISDIYEVPIYSERHWELIEAYIKTAVDCGINVILTPVITPPLDTANGRYRPNVQLVDIKVVGEDKYEFGFAKLERFIDICKRSGVKYYEIAQLFSQWGLKFAPPVVAEVNGKDEYIFGWHVEGTSPKYAEFLRQFVPKLVECLKEQGVYENAIFHISDEPHIGAIDAYKYGHDLLRPLVGDAKFMDALSNYAFYESGLVDIPATYTAEMENFIGKDVKEQWVYYAEDKKGISINRLNAPSYRIRVIGVQMFKYNIKGFLHWGFNFYNTALSFHRVNPYLTTSGDRTLGSGGPFSVYPAANGAYLSRRSMLFYEGIQDMAVCRLLEEKVGHEEAVRIIEEEANMTIDFCEYPRNDEFLPRLRARIAKELAK